MTASISKTDPGGSVQDRETMHQGEFSSPTVSVGRYVRRMVGQPGFSGRVLARPGQTLYFLGPGGQLAWIAQPNHSRHRRAIVVKFDSSSVTDDSRLESRCGSLVLEGIPPIAISQAPSWSPEPFDPHHLRQWDDLRAEVRALVVGIGGLPNRRGLGHAIELLLGNQGSMPLGAQGSMDKALWEAAYQPISEIIRASRDGSAEDVFNSGLRIIGLGPGLTPAGDDFMGGLLFAIHQLRRAYPGWIQWGIAGRNAFLKRAQTSTNQISYTILRDAAHGHGPEPVHGLVWALLHGETQSRTRSNAEKVVTIGHTSGWDMLAGVVTGMSQVFAQGIS